MNTKYREKRGRTRERKRKKIKTVVCLQWWWHENQLRDIGSGEYKDSNKKILKI